MQPEHSRSACSSKTLPLPAFYKTLGFHSIGGNGKSWLILQNDTATIRAPPGRHPEEHAHVQPGLGSQLRKDASQFEDVRDIQKAIKAKASNRPSRRTNLPPAPPSSW